jgi:Spy/CpxP family protein refolding chaperone
MNKNLLFYAIGILVIAGFALSVIAGFNVGQAHGIATGRHWRDRGYILQRVATGLNLTPEQRAKFEPLVAEADPQLSAIEADARKKGSEVIDGALGQIRPMLTQEQQKKLDELQDARRDLHTARDRVRSLTMR